MTAPVAQYYQEGVDVDYTPTVAVNAGDVIVQDDLVGVSILDIAANVKGSLRVEGVFIVQKAAVAFAVGQRVFFDVVNKVATSDPTAGPLMGKALTAQVSGDASVVVVIDQVMTRELYYALTAAGTALTNSTVETTLGSANFPANSLQVGDVIRFRAQGIATAVHSTDTLTVKAYFAGVQLVATAAVNPTVNDGFFVNGDVVIRTIGANGTFVGCGDQCLGTPGTVNPSPWLKASSAVDTTAAELLKLTGTYSVANGGNSCRLDVLDVELKRQQ